MALRWTVLVVDDEALVARALWRVLSQRFDVQAVASLALARDLLATWTPDIVLTDWALADGDGGDVLAHAAERAPSALRIVLSAHPPIARPALAHHVLSKPWPGTLSDDLAAWLAEHRLRA